jgi:hypothetical protein
MAWFTVIAAVLGGCAVGTYRNSRLAAIVGFVLSLIGFIYLLPLVTYAGVRGAFAAARLRRAARE